MGEVSFRVGEETITLTGVISQDEFRSVSRAQLNVVRALIRALQDAGALNGLDLAQELLSLADADSTSSTRAALQGSAGAECKEAVSRPVLRVVTGGKAARE